MVTTCTAIVPPSQQAAVEPYISVNSAGGVISRKEAKGNKIQNQSVKKNNEEGLLKGDNRDKCKRYGTVSDITCL